VNVRPNVEMNIGGNKDAAGHGPWSAEHNKEISKDWPIIAFDRNAMIGHDSRGTENLRRLAVPKGGKQFSE
jgi:hypothetical protein